MWKQNIKQRETEIEKERWCVETEIEVKESSDKNAIKIVIEMFLYSDKNDLKLNKAYF